MAAIVSRLLAWFSSNARDLPWRRTTDPYAIWVSEIMLQQTQVKTVLPYWERWMKSIPDIRTLARARPEQLHKLWEGLGYYTRVRNMQKAAQVILEQHGGQFPEQFDAVLALPGIGRYTAGAVCSIAFNQPQPILDGNVMRVLTRLFAISGDPRDKETNLHLWQLAQQLVQEAASTHHAPRSTLHAPRSTLHAPRSTLHAPACSHLNQSLMELGALICTPQQPRCEVCPVRKQCIARRQDRVDAFPQLRPRAPATQRRFAAFIAEKNGHFLVRQRPAGVVNAHLWEFPNAELAQKDSKAEQAAKAVLGRKPARLVPFCTLKHTITRYRITLDAFQVPAGSVARAAAVTGSWLTPLQLSRLPFTSAHKKILERIQAGRRSFFRRCSPASGVS